MGSTIGGVAPTNANLGAIEREGLVRTQPNDPLHGVTLETIVRRLVDEYGWGELAAQIDINCFKSDPSVSSTLKFLRKTPWARKQVEDLFVSSKLWTRD